MNKEEAIAFYTKDMEEGFAPKYGDIRTTESIEKCHDQVMQKIEEGATDWDGCVSKGLCCKAFTQKVNVKKAMIEGGEDMEAFANAHFDGEEDSDTSISIVINHTCNLLGEDNRCTKYEDRPKICREYLCQASKLRRDMFWRIKYPSIVTMVDNETNKEKDK